MLPPGTKGIRSLPSTPNIPVGTRPCQYILVGLIVYFVVVFLYHCSVNKDTIFFKIIALHHYLYILIIMNYSYIIVLKWLWLLQSNVPCMLSARIYQKLHMYVSLQLIQEVRKIQMWYWYAEITHLR